MEGNVGAIFLLSGCFLLGVAVGSHHQKSSVNINIESQDPCKQIHGLKTIQSRDYKPKYERELKQVVSTCGDK